MKKLKAEIMEWCSGQLYSVYMGTGRRGNIETGNYKTKGLAKRAFISMCNRLGIDKSIYEFVD